MPQVNEFSWTNMSILLLLIFFSLLFSLNFYVCNLKKIEFLNLKSFYFFYLI